MYKTEPNVKPKPKQFVSEASVDRLTRNKKERCVAVITADINILTRLHCV